MRRAIPVFGAGELRELGWVEGLVGHGNPLSLLPGRQQRGLDAARPGRGARGAGPEFEYRYKQSVAITEFGCEHHQDLPIHPDGPKTGEIAGIVYPALQTRGDADNLMFCRKFVHSSLALRHVQYVLVEKADHTRLAFTFLSLALGKGVVNGTSIVWREDLPSEDARRCHIALKDGKWVQRRLAKGLLDQLMDRIRVI
jgi:hypothetical protein